MAIPKVINSSDLLTSEELKYSFKVFAGPGAGKTYFLVKNIINIIKTNDAYKNSKLKRLACITYTNAAADEIKNRLGNHYQNIFVDTIHSFIYENIIKQFMPLLIKHLNNKYGLELPIYTKIKAQQEGQSVLHGHTKEEILASIGAIEKNYSRKKMCKVEFDFENGDVLSDKDKQIDQYFYQSIKQFIWGTCNVFSHTDILHFGLYLVKKYRLIRYYLQTAFPYILIDEFQDTSPYQTALIKELSKHNIIFGVVGDVAQSIYSFQGAKSSDFEEMSFNDKEIRYYQIEGNRRSSDNLVKFFNQLRRGDTLQQKSIRHYCSENEKLTVENTPITIINKTSEKGINLLNELTGRNVPILTRTWPQAFDYISGIGASQKHLIKQINSTYYHTIEDLRNDIITFRNIDWVKGVTCILKLQDAFLSNSFNYILDAFLYIDRDCQSEMIQYVKKTANILSLTRILSSVFSTISDDDCVKNIVDKINAKLKNEPDLAFLFKDNREAFIPFLDEFEFSDRNDLLSQLTYGTVKKLFVDVFSSNSSYMTIHQAKGREWDDVIVDLKPSLRSLDKGKELTKVFNTYSIKGVDNEYQRIVYVACTRAKNHLYIIVNNCTESQAISQMCDKNGIIYKIIS